MGKSKTEVNIPHVWNTTPHHTEYRTKLCIPQGVFKLLYTLKSLKISTMKFSEIVSEFAEHPVKIFAATCFPLLLRNQHVTRLNLGQRHFNTIFF